MKIGETLYHCRRTIDTNKFVEYSNAVGYRTRLGYITCRPTGGYVDTLELGEKVSHSWKIIANYDKFKNKFNEGDLLFLDGKVPNSANGNGANAIITSVRYQNKVIMIIAETLDLQGKGLKVD